MATYYSSWVNDPRASGTDYTDIYCASIRIKAVSDGSGKLKCYAQVAEWNDYRTWSTDEKLNWYLYKNNAQVPGTTYKTSAPAGPQARTAPLFEVYLGEYSAGASVSAAYQIAVNLSSDGWHISSTASVTYTLPALPTAPTIGTASISGSTATVSWTNRGTYANVLVYGDVNGTEQLMATVAGTATSTSVTVPGDASARFRVAGKNDVGTGAKSGWTSYVYTVPSAPTSLTGARSTGTQVDLVSDNQSSIATGYELQWSESSGFETIAGSDTGSGVFTSGSYSVSSSTGTVWFRLRNTRGSDYGPWTASNAVQVQAPPNAPTPTSPQTGSTVATGGTVTLSAVYNSADGSARTSRQWRVSANGGASWTTYTDNSDSHVLQNAYASGTTVTWGARDKGALNEWGPWSDNQTFIVKTPPTVTVTAPSGTVTSMPIQYRASYQDAAGSFAAGTLTVLHNGMEVYSEALTGQMSGSVTATEFLPLQGETYTFRFDARSTTGLRASASVDVGISFTPPKGGTLEQAFDADTGEANITVGFGTGEGVSIEYLTLFRVTDGTRVLLADNLTDGAGVTDVYAPINHPYEYELVSHASSGAVKAVAFHAMNGTNRHYFVWGGGTEWAVWAPSGSKKVSRAQEYVSFFGKRLPVLFDPDKVDVSVDQSFTLTALEASSGFERMARTAGSCIVKSPDGSVFRAGITGASFNRVQTSRAYMDAVTVSMRMVEGEAQ